jgi:hypothetical protein
MAEEPPPKRAKSLLQVRNVRALCSDEANWSYDTFVFVPAVYEEWTGGGMALDRSYPDEYPDGRQISVCSRYLKFVFDRFDKPSWFETPGLDLIDVRRDGSTLYFFWASRELVHERKQNSKQMPAHEKLAGVLRLVPNEQLPADAFENIREYFDVPDVANIRPTASAVWDLPVHKFACNELNIDFNMHRGVGLHGIELFEEKLKPTVERVLAECAQLDPPVERIKRVVIDRNERVEEDMPFFFKYATHSPFMKNLLSRTDLLVFPNLALTPNAVVGLKDLLEKTGDSGPNVAIDRLLMRRDQFEPIPAKYRARVFVTHLQCATRPEVVEAISSHPVASFDCDPSRIQRDRSSFASYGRW